MWIHYGVGRSARLIAVHEISASLGPTKCSVLPTFHALTGCDTTSAFYGKGKKTAWLTWEAYPDLTQQALLTLSQVTAVVDAETLSVLERFVILLYDRTSECESFDLARKHVYKEIQNNGKCLSNCSFAAYQEDSLPGSPLLVTLSRSADAGL